MEEPFACFRVFPRVHLVANRVAVPGAFRGRVCMPTLGKRPQRGPIGQDRAGDTGPFEKITTIKHSFPLNKTFNVLG